MLGFFVYVLIILVERSVMDFIVGLSFCAVGLFVCCVCCIHMCYICFFLKGGIVCVLWCLMCRGCMSLLRLLCVF